MPRYTARVRVHLQLILLLQLLRSFTRYPENLVWTGNWINRVYDAMFPPHPTLGTFYKASMRSIPEFGAAKDALRDICKDLILTLTPPDDSSELGWFLTLCIKVTFFAFHFDAQHAREYMEGAAYVKVAPYPEFYAPQGVHILENLFGSYLGHPDSTAQGALLINRIVHEELQMDIKVLCDFIDRQVALSSACIQYKMDPQLRKFGIPHSWLQYLRTVYSLAEIGDMMLDKVPTLVWSIIKLINHIYQGTGAGLLLGGSLLRDSWGVPHATFILRLCRALAILGYYLSDGSPLKQDIILCFSSLDSAEFHVRPYLQTVLDKYFLVKTWDHVVHRVRGMTAELPCDPMVPAAKAERKPAMVAEKEPQGAASGAISKKQEPSGVEAVTFIQVPTTDGVVKHFLICLASAAKLAWTPECRYHQSFLSLLPHALFALDELDQYLGSKEDEMDALPYPTDEDETLALIVKSETQLERPHREGAKELQRVLAPESDIHRQQDLGLLREYLERVCLLFNEAAGEGECIVGRDNAWVAYKGIIDPKPFKFQVLPFVVGVSTNI